MLLIQERWKNKMKVIIVGGVAGGATAAARIRRLDEHAEITVFERSGYISYANCGLPYYIGDVITDPEELTLQTPESFFKRFRINMKIHHEVISIHPERKTVSVKNLENDEIFEEIGSQRPLFESCNDTTGFLYHEIERCNGNDTIHMGRVCKHSPVCAKRTSRRILRND